MKVPGELYTPSPRPYQGLGDLDYPFHDWSATVTRCGRICYNRKKINLSIVFAGQNVGVKQVSDNIGSSASCTTISDTSILKAAGSSQSTTHLARKCYRCLRNDL